MKNLVLVLFLAFSIHNAAAQEFEAIRHTVQMGETVRMISRKYKIEPTEIYRLNKFAVDGIQQGMVLQLLVPKKEVAASDEKQVVLSENFEEKSATTSDEKSTTAEGKSVKTVEKSQENPVAISAEKQAADPTEISHKVEPKETLYSLSKKYNVTVEEIKRQNEPLLKKGLQVGQILTIRTNSLTGED